MAKGKTGEPQTAGDKNAGDKLESLIDRTITSAPGGKRGEKPAPADDDSTLQRDPEDK